MKKKQEESIPSEHRFATLKSSTASKANGTKITYEVGYDQETDEILFRIVTNQGGGTFSKEWVRYEAVKNIMADLAKTGTPFSPGVHVGKAFVGKSRNNGPFLSYALIEENLLIPDAEKGNLTTVSENWSSWEESTRKGIKGKAGGSKRVLKAPGA